MRFRSLSAVCSETPVFYYWNDGQGTILGQDVDVNDIEGLVITADLGRATLVVPASNCSFSPAAIYSASDNRITISATIGRTRSADLVISPQTFDPTLANNSFEKIAMAAALGWADKIWTLGQTLSFVDLDGTTLTARLIAFNHDSLSTSDAQYSNADYNGGSKKAAMTFRILTAKGTEFYHSPTGSWPSDGSWKTSTLRTSVMESYFQKLPQTLRDSIRTVVKKSVAPTSISYNIINSDDKLFIPSMFELGGNVPTNNSSNYTLEKNNNPQYEYYSLGNTIDHLNSSYDWTRSPHWNCSYGYWHMYAHNSSGYAQKDEVKNYFLPLFCI